MRPIIERLAFLFSVRNIFNFEFYVNLNSHRRSALYLCKFKLQRIDELNDKCFPGWQHRRRPFWWLENDEQLSSSEASETINTSKTLLPNKREEEESTTEIINDEISNEFNKAKCLDWTCQVLLLNSKQLPLLLLKWLQLCGKEFKPSSNFLRHVAKDHLNIPLYQCPICKGHGGQDAYDVRSHM